MIFVFLITSHVLKFDVICVVILILLVATSTLCCNGQGLWDWGSNPSQGLMN
jgi:hypothetical protein